MHQLLQSAFRLNVARHVVRHVLATLFNGTFHTIESTCRRTRFHKQQQHYQRNWTTGQTMNQRSIRQFEKTFLIWQNLGIFNTHSGASLATSDSLTSEDHRRSSHKAGMSPCGRPELTTGRVHPRVGSGRVTKLEKISGSGRIGSRRSKSKKIVHLSYLTCNESLLLLIESLLPQGGIGKRHSATSRSRH